MKDSTDYSANIKKLAKIMTDPNPELPMYGEIICEDYCSDLCFDECVLRSIGCATVNTHGKNKNI